MKFAMNKEFKDLPIGRVPKDWVITRLENIIEDIYYGITAKAVEYKTNLKMLRTTDIKNYKVDWESLPFCEITDKRTKIDKYLLRKNDLVIARAGTIGISILVEKDFNNVIFGSYLIKIKLKQNVFPKFIHYFLQSNFYWNQINKYQAGSTLKNISLPILKSLILPIPPLSEQEKITEILSTVDSATEKLNEEISKIEQLKKGLMQELLTKGIGHKEFKDSLIGKIPKDWETVKLSEIAKIIMGQSPPSSTYNNIGEGLPFLQGKLEFGEVYPSPRIYCSDPIKIAEAGDILISVRAPVGDVNLAPYKLCIGRGLAAIRINAKKGNYKFYFYYLKKEKDSWEKLSKGSTFKAINKNDIENFIVPLPPLSEQQKIAEILSTVDELLDLKRRKKEKLAELKKGLMNLLLTGKIRVVE